jgi:flagellar hook-length control protein FliK
MNTDLFSVLSATPARSADISARQRITSSSDSLGHLDAARREDQTGDKVEPKRSFADVVERLKANKQPEDSQRKTSEVVEAPRQSRQKSGPASTDRAEQRNLDFTAAQTAFSTAQLPTNPTVHLAPAARPAELTAATTSISDVLASTEPVTQAPVGGTVDSQLTVVATDVFFGASPQPDSMTNNIRIVTDCDTCQVSLMFDHDAASNLQSRSTFNIHPETGELSAPLASSLSDTSAIDINQEDPGVTLNEQSLFADVNQATLIPGVQLAVDGNSQHNPSAAVQQKQIGAEGIVANARVAGGQRANRVAHEVARGNAPSSSAQNAIDEELAASQDPSVASVDDVGMDTTQLTVEADEIIATDSSMVASVDTQHSVEFDASSSTELTEAMSDTAGATFEEVSIADDGLQSGFHVVRSSQGAESSAMDMGKDDQRESDTVEGAAASLESTALGGAKETSGAEFSLAVDHGVGEPSGGDLGVADQAEVSLDQLAADFREDWDEAKMRGKDTFEIELDPPELGRIRVQMREVDGGMHVRLLISQQHAHQAALTDVARLRGALEQAGVQLDGLSVSLDMSGQQQQASQEQAGSGSGWRTHSPQLPVSHFAGASSSGYANGESARGAGAINVIC